MSRSRPPRASGRVSSASLWASRGSPTSSPTLIRASRPRSNARLANSAGVGTMTDTEVTDLPVTGAWRVGDPPGDRQFAAIGTMPLEWAPPLPDVVLAYETWGTFTGDNAVLVEHALTGDAHVVGEPGPGQVTGGWWDGLIGPGLALDTDR